MGCRNDYCTVKLNLLAQTDLDVSSSWWHVNDQVVEFSPPCVEKELWENFGDHDSPHGSRFRTNKTKGHAFHVFINDGFNLFWILLRWSQRLIFLVNQCWKWRAIYIGVKNTDFESLVFEGGSNVNGDSTFTDASLATAYCNYLLDLGKVLLFCELLFFGLRSQIYINIRKPILFQILFYQAFQSTIVLSEIQHQRHLLSLRVDVLSCNQISV